MSLGHPFLMYRDMLQEQREYLTRQLITCIGNKRNLLDFIGTVLLDVKKRLKKDKLILLDMFSGSGIVSRFFKQHAQKLISNDLELYAKIINQCYLANAEYLDITILRDIHSGLIQHLEQNPLVPGFISELYAPRNDTHIQPNERVFYTTRNARFIDTVRRYISTIEEQFQPFFIAPLLAESSVHANTAGVFKGFYKDETGVGRFGGRGGHALPRIQGDMELSFPIFSSFNCETEIHQADANQLIYDLEEVDLAYLDPPYNQHPYGSNYFMLNLIAEYKRPGGISPVSGIPRDWHRSEYNGAASSLQAFTQLVQHIKAKYLLISFNSDGFISRDVMQETLEKTGRLEVFETPYNTFRGSRNLRNRAIHVTEFLYLVEKR